MATRWVSYWGGGDGTFGPAMYTAVGPGPVAVVVGDFNRDGRRDVAVANVGGDSLTFLFGDGKGGFKAAVSVDTRDGLTALAAADMNGDGKLALVATAQNEGALRVVYQL